MWTWVFGLMSNLILTTPFFSLLKKPVFNAGEVTEKHPEIFHFAANTTKQKIMF